MKFYRSVNKSILLISCCNLCDQSALFQLARRAGFSHFSNHFFLRESSTNCRRRYCVLASLFFLARRGFCMGPLIYSSDVCFFRPLSAFDPSGHEFIFRWVDRHSDSLHSSIKEMKVLMLVCKNILREIFARGSRYWTKISVRSNKPPAFPDIDNR